MEIIVNRAGPSDTNIIGQIAVRAQQPTALIALTASVKVKHLTGGVDTGIGAAGTDNLYCLVGYRRQRLFHSLLYAQPRPLALPAVIGGAVVLYTERDTDGRMTLVVQAVRFDH
jgi:hypothetical protein